MNIGNMAKSMNDVERYSPISVGDSYCPCADMDTDPDGEWVSYAAYSALQQQLAAAREELAYTEAVAAVMEAAIHKIAARRILATGDTSIPDLSAEEANRAAFDVYNAIATLQRDRQP